MVEPADGKIQFSHEIIGNVARFFEQVDEMGLEGIVSKQAAAPIRAVGRGPG